MPHPKLATVGTKIAERRPHASGAARVPDDAAPQKQPGRIDHALLARLVIREGKSFRASAIQAGYSRAVASKGLKAAMSVSTVLADAIRAEWDRVSISIDRLKPLALARLYREIADPESSYGVKAVEVAGKLKEADWFIRTGETNLGIFQAIIESAAIPEPADPDDFRE